MKLLTSTILFLFALSVNAQMINNELKERLDSIYNKDQGIRELMDIHITTERKHEILETLGLKEDEFDNNSYGLMHNYDKENIEEVKKIIDEFGYPGKTLVGEPTNKSVYYVIQHSDFIEEYFPLIKKAGEKDELPKTLVAMMEDRLLMQKGLCQKYGTQVYWKRIINSETEENEMFRFIWPVENPEKINELRKSIGINSTIEEYAERVGIEYEIYTIDEINDLINK